MTDHLPPRDRRQRRRILTLRNSIWILGAILVVFGAYSLWNELHPKSDDGLALLEERQQRVENDIVREVTPYVADDERVAELDPRLPISAEPSRKDEFLGVEDPEPRHSLQREDTVMIAPLGTNREPAPSPSLQGSDVPFAAQRSTASGSRIKISGAGNSLTLETSDDGP